jgi:hypothetical protein
MLYKVTFDDGIPALRQQDFRQYWRKLSGFSPIGIEQYEGSTYARTMPSTIRIYPDAYIYECIPYQSLQTMRELPNDSTCYNAIINF